MRRWFARTKLLLESEQIQLTTNTLDDMTLNSYRILTTQDTVSLAAIGNAPNVNGASLSGNTLNLQPAKASLGGVVTTNAQTFTGLKTFSTGISAPGVVTGLSAIGATPNANGATIAGSNLNLEPANGSFGGVVTTEAQTIAGLKTFTGKTRLSGTKDNASFVIDVERVLVINGNTGELSCRPPYSPPSDSDWMLDSGTITTSTITPPRSSFYAIFAGNMIHLTVQPSGMGNMLVTANTGSPTVLKLTGSLQLVDIQPPGDTSWIGPFINNGVFTYAKWTMSLLGEVTVELIPPGTVFTAPFGVGSNSFTLSYITSNG